MSRPRLLLDSNVWRYMVDEYAVEVVLKAAKSHGVDIVACPAVAYEALRVNDRDLRRRLVEAITRGSWMRPMPEAFQEAEALRSELARRRPEWINPSPDLRMWHHLRADWDGGAWWRRARHAPHREAALIDALGGEDLARAREEAQNRRGDARAGGLTYEGINIAEVRAVFETPVPGWDGTPFEPWRVHGMYVWWSHLTDPSLSAGSTLAQWLAPWLLLDAVRRDWPSWLSFWLTETSSASLPHEWMRWATTWVQQTRKVTAGTPVDSQISSYLFETDCLVTSDGAFVQCLEKVRPHSPRPFATTLVLPGGNAAIPALESIVAVFDGSHDLDARGGVSDVLRG